MKIIVSALAVIIVLAGGWLLFSERASAPTNEENLVTSPAASEGAKVPAPGTYTVATSESSIGWSAQKPLIEGYVHRGTIGLSGGEIVVGDGEATGTFTLAMNSIKVTSLGGGKEGRESALEGHLKNSDFFDVTNFPTATFTITGGEILNQAEHRYNVTGTLLMKGVSGEVTFPATIYEEDGTLYAKGTFQIDRTKWGITFGSGSFFDNLANNMIDDMVSLELNIVARGE